MRRLATVLLVLFVGAAAVLLWGYWYAIRHASLQINVDDYALKTDRQLYGTPHDVTVVFRDASGSQLALAKSIEPLAHILAVHPDAAIGTCEQSTDHAACYEKYSAWSAMWADRVKTADVTVGSCSLRAVPVTMFRSNSEWPLWWVPLPHIGGLPRQYFSFEVAVDSRACRSVTDGR